MTDVSILIPTYNRREFLAEALQSVREQTHGSFECVVVDGNSTDGTADLLDALDDDWLRVHRHDERRGLPAARNTGLELADGEYVLFLDSDDLLYPFGVDRLVTALDSRPATCAGAFAASHHVTRHDRVIYQSVPAGPMTEPTVENARAITGPSGTIFRRDALEAIGGFDESLPSRADVDAFLRVLEEYSLFGIDEACWVRRLHDDQMSADREAIREANELLAEKHRHRSNGGSG
jgi:glycosyltransferase involved in cell wall biosynthesis